MFRIMIVLLIYHRHKLTEFIYPKIFENVMEPEVSLTCSQEATTGLCLEAEESSPYHPHSI
jgi:hypothetical protein